MNTYASTLCLLLPYFLAPISYVFDGYEPDDVISAEDQAELMNAPDSLKEKQQQGKFFKITIVTNMCTEYS